MLAAHKCFGTLLISFTLFTSAAWSQQKGSGVTTPLAPYPALSSGDARSQDAGQDTNNGPTLEGNPLTQDKRPLSGAQELTLGGVSKAHGFLLPSFQFTQGLDTNSFSSPGPSRREWLSTLAGHMALQKTWAHSQVNIDYVGGRFFSSTRSNLNAAFHQVSFAQTIKGGRWEMLLADQFAYLPEASFGFTGFGGLEGSSSALSGALTSPLPGLNPAFLPSQTTLTGRTRRTSNISLAQLTYTASPRSSFTFSGSYGILRFRESGFINSNNAMFRTGYNYALTGRDTIAIIYGFSTFRFASAGQNLNNHIVQLSYGRRVTGRLALQLAAGPQIITSRNSSRGLDERLFWSAQASLLYRLSKTDLSLSYLRYITGGSGALAGAETDSVQATLGRQLSRMWSGSVSLGFAHNTSLGQSTIGPNGPRYDSWYSKVALSRPLGRYVSLQFFYNLQFQNSNVSVCTAGTCGTSLVRHQIWVGFNWHWRPIRID